MNTPKAVTHKINKSIAEIAAFADKLPGVTIIHDLRDWTVAWMSNRGLKNLGVTLEEITSLPPGEYYKRYFNPEDSADYAPKIFGLLDRNIADEICTLFQQVRFHEHTDWKWHMASTMVLLRDEYDKPLLGITLAFPIDPMHHMTAKAERLLEENNFLRRNFHLFDKLGKREREVLQHLALGKSALETAEAMFISIGTVETHRKNIRKKLGTSSFFELSQYARAFDLI
ncbi:helix-turn-helix transcriptional regulator [Mucilaginibacter auburnensis]|uniref:Regulatory LuxR family protein n=1 Tax=Mucilaginibacter auburnensis TaxID=1457233 RepID=A0A2H9VP11_9SPHI|nr:helix-turn-helix transcriptional regulator [Mucilaginibacter auburnensis]PJJ80057.1 regulatory LuxR family protein [Mucilaginibacter auburnensis]